MHQPETIFVQLSLRFGLYQVGSFFRQHACTGSKQYKDLPLLQLEYKVSKPQLYFIRRESVPYMLTDVFLLDIIRQLLRLLNWFICFTYTLNTQCHSSLLSEPHGLFMIYLQMLFLDLFQSVCLDFTITLVLYIDLI